MKEPKNWDFDLFKRFVSFKVELIDSKRQRQLIKIPKF